MNKMKISMGKIHMELSGSKRFIQRESEKFLDYVKKQDIENVEEKRDTESVGMKNGVTNSCEVMMVTRSQKTMGWKKIADGIKNGTLAMEIGSTVTCTLTNGIQTEFIITDITDQYVRFETKNFIGRSKWDEQEDFEGGYPDASIREYVDSVIWNLLPEDLREVISEVERKYKVPDKIDSTYKTKLFLPASSELFSRRNCSGDIGLYEQLDFYKELKNRVRVDEDGRACRYWLASMYFCNFSDIPYSTYTCTVDYNGTSDSYASCYSAYVPVCFHISKI